MGINDISAKVHGSSHPFAVAQAFIKVLKRQKTPQDICKETGMKIASVDDLYR